MHWNRWIRHGHRWLSVAFTMVILLNVVAAIVGMRADWMGLLGALVLVLLLPSGLYLFALPYGPPRRRTAGEQAP